MIYVISVFFEHIAGQFSVHSPVARNILLGLLTLLLCFGPVILGTSGEKKRKRALEEYFSTKRPGLLLQKYPDATYSNSYDFPSLYRNDYADYRFQMDLDYPGRTFRLTHYLADSTYLSDGETRRNYMNACKIIPTSLSGHTGPLPGYFYYLSNSTAITHGIETLVNRFSPQDKVQQFEQTRTYDEIPMHPGVLAYQNIPKKEWDAFTSHGIIHTIRQIQAQWNGIATVHLRYEKQTLTLYIYGPVHKGAIFSCLEDDFLIEYADRIQRSIELLNTIADFL